MTREEKIYSVKEGVLTIEEKIDYVEEDVLTIEEKIDSVEEDISGPLDKGSPTMMSVFCPRWSSRIVEELLTCISFGPSTLHGSVKCQ